MRQLQHVALHGFSSWPECNRTLEGRAVHVDNTDWGKDSNSPIILYTDPMLAVEASALGSFKIEKIKKCSNIVCTIIDCNYRYFVIFFET